MKRVFAVALAAAAVSSAMAQNYTDTAQVLSAQPIYERTSVPRQECNNETVTTDRRVPSQGYVDAGYQPNAQPQPYAQAQPYAAPVAPPSATGERTIGAGTIIGAILGGVVGHQLGGSSGGRDHGSVAGVVLGGLLGNQIENSGPTGGVASAPTYAAPPAASGPARVDYIPETRTVQRCRTVYDGRDEITGYNVVYRYQGRDYTTRMAYDPGPTMNVRVNLAPDVAVPRR